MARPRSRPGWSSARTTRSWPGSRVPRWARGRRCGRAPRAPRNSRGWRGITPGGCGSRRGALLRLARRPAPPGVGRLLQAPVRGYWRTCWPFSAATPTASCSPSTTSWRGQPRAVPHPPRPGAAPSARAPRVRARRHAARDRYRPLPRLPAGPARAPRAPASRPVALRHVVTRRRAPPTCPLPGRSALRPPGPV